MLASIFKNNHDGTSENMGTTGSTGNTNVDDITIYDWEIPINNPAGGYFVKLSNLDNNMRFNLLRIKYKYTIPWYAYPLYSPMLRQ